MAISGRALDRRSAATRTGGVIAAALARNPGALAAGGAFAVAFAFVSSNALWHQPFRHPGALFATRDPAVAPVTGGTVAPAQPDPKVKVAQAALRDLGYYTGAVDGLRGPATRKAIADFQTAMGLPPTAQVDASLLEALRQTRDALGAAPSSERTGDIAKPDADGGDDIRKLQAGLRAFGLTEIGVDGVLGSRTRDGIRKFQIYAGLPETGEPDALLFRRMRERGLID